MKSMLDLQLKSNRGLLRPDFAVPIDDERNVTDDTRIRMVLLTIEHAIKE